MGPEDRRGGRASGKDEFEGRDLLVGRPQGAEGRPGAGAEQSPTAATSSQATAHESTIREILEKVRAMAAKIDTLPSATGPENETTEALARETAALALAQAVEDARGSLAETAEFAAQREKKASSGAGVLTEGVAALDRRGKALAKLIRTTGQQAEETDRHVNESAGQAKEVTKGMTGLKETAEALELSLRDHAQNVSRTTKRLRWRPWLMGLALGAVSFIFFVVGAVSQRETDVVSFGDPRHEWNEFVAEHYAPTIAACASEARTDNVIIRCRLRIRPRLDMTIPLYPGVILTDVPPEEQTDPTTER